MEKRRFYAYFLRKALHSFLGLRSTRWQLSTILGSHFEQPVHQKSKKHGTKEDCEKDTFTVRELKQGLISAGNMCMFSYSDFSHSMHV